MKKILPILFAICCFSCINLQAQNLKDIQADTIYQNISVADAYTMVQNNSSNPEFIILDVRTSAEYEGGHIANSLNMNYYSATFSTDLDTLDKNKIYLVHCQSGGRSALAFSLMQQKHFREVYNMLGGMNSWVSAGYPTTTITATNYEFRNQVVVFPNPVKDYLSISGPEPIVHISVFDITGKIVAASNPGIYNSDIDLSELTHGIYVVQIVTEKGNFTKRIVKN